MAACCVVIYRTEGEDRGRDWKQLKYTYLSWYRIRYYRKERKEVKKEVVRVHNDTSLVTVLNTGTGNLNGWYGYTYNTSQALNFIGFMT